MSEILLEQFDSDFWGILRPEYVIEKPDCNFPETIVCEFSKSMIQTIVEKYNGKKIGRLISVAGDIPIYEVFFKNVRIGICQVMVGAPACVTNFEELVALGAKKIFICGECGVLDNTIDDAYLIIPTSAIRDEGTSYHYQPASDEIILNPHGVKVIESVFKSKGLPYIKGKIWTTDAPYRETRNKMLARKKQGCIAVEMECAAVAAAAQFRNVIFSQFVYACDNLDSDVWEQRGLTIRPISQKVHTFELAMECAIKL
ncbi:nucleoside phosphorylase [Clostridioides difficile]